MAATELGSMPNLTLHHLLRENKEREREKMLGETLVHHAEAGLKMRLAAYNETTGIFTNTHCATVCHKHAETLDDAQKVNLCVTSALLLLLVVIVVVVLLLSFGLLQIY